MRAALRRVKRGTRLVPLVFFIAAQFTSVPRAAVLSVNDTDLLRLHQANEEFIATLSLAPGEPTFTGTLYVYFGHCEGFLAGFPRPVLINPTCSPFHPSVLSCLWDFSSSQFVIALANTPMTAQPLPLVTMHGAPDISKCGDLNCWGNPSYSLTLSDCSFGLFDCVSGNAFQPEITFSCSCDPDGDGLCTDNCPTTANPDQVDSDADGHGDACDPCPLDPLDDVDADTVCGDTDNCPTVPNLSQANADADSLGDACDVDVDGDNVPDADEACFCLATPVNTPVSVYGCSVDQLCPCAAPPGRSSWMRRSEFMRCVRFATEELVEQGRLTPVERKSALLVARSTTCGKSSP